MREAGLAGQELTADHALVAGIVVDGHPALVARHDRDEAPRQRQRAQLVEQHARRVAAADDDRRRRALLHALAKTVADAASERERRGVASLVFVECQHTNAPEPHDGPGARVMKCSFRASGPRARGGVGRSRGCPEFGQGRVALQEGSARA